jgi:site-specific DNA-methyltransferase (adenine-specific)
MSGPVLYARRVNVEPIFETGLGKLYNADCLEVLPQIGEQSVDLVFADPPFNLGKDYGTGVNDSLKDKEYLRWCERWIAEGVRVLKPGGAFFLWNLPRWNV